jgi:aminopeptidase N
VAGNLTREEARERARLLTVSSYAVELDFTAGEETFTSITEAAFACSSPGAVTFIDLEASAIHEITLNGSRVDPGAFAGGRITLPALQASNELRVVADCAYSRTGEGLHRFTDPADGEVYLYTHFEPADAHRLYACFDQPDLKASFELTVTAQVGWQVISNTEPDAPPRPVRGAAGEAGAPDSVRWHFPPTPVMSTYITAVAAGPYHSVRGDADGIPLGVYCRKSLASYLDADEILEVTRQGFGFYHGAFGVRYPFGKYDQLFVPEFNAGAMENAGCVTFLEEYVFRSRVTDFVRERRGETILHEMAHMWFGDLVTMRWWDDLWLNESFATFASAMCQAEATRWTGVWTTFAQLYKAAAYRQDQLSSTHPISADIPDIRAVEVNFDGITYFKGASVLKQLVAYVGRDNFLAGLRGYFGRHAWGNATLADLLAALEETSGRDLAAWSRDWLETAGPNTLRPQFEVGADGAFTSFAVLQEAPADHPTLRTHRIAVGLYDRTGDGIVRRDRVELDISGPRTEVPALAGKKQPDLVLLNDDDLTYAKIRLDDRSMQTVVESPADIAESLPAALCWAAAWDMCRDAELPAHDYVRLVLRGIGSVREINVLQTLLRQAISAARRFTDPQRRQATLETVASTLHTMLRGAEPGSDAQLACIQALAGVATSGDHLALLAGLLDGSESLDGLTVDTELRWLLLHRLVSQGAVGEEKIGTELERDSTAAGERHAASCRAAIPDPAGKRAAWEQIIGVAGRPDLAESGKPGPGPVTRDGEPMTNAMFRATLGGFANPDQPSLLEPYAPLFFQVVGDIWQTWTSDMAQYFVSVGYPSTPVSERTVADTDRYIDEKQPPPALRRLLSENRDDMIRALRAQACDRRAGTG